MFPAYRRTIIDKLKRTAGMDDIEERIVVERHLTPQDIHERYKVLNGAIYGLASHGKFMGAFKPGNRSRQVRGLYLAGGAAHPGPGMPMVMMSGWIAADALDADHQERDSAEGVLTRNPAQIEGAPLPDRQERLRSRAAPPSCTASWSGSFRRFFTRHMNALRVARWGVPDRLAGAGPVVVYSNHPAWWDAVVYILAADHFLPDHESYAPIDAAMLKRYGFFGRIGAFGVDLDTRARRGGRSCAAGADILSRAGPRACGSPRRDASATCASARSASSPASRVCRTRARLHGAAARHRVRLLAGARRGGLPRLRARRCTAATCCALPPRRGCGAWKSALDGDPGPPGRRRRSPRPGALPDRCWRAAPASAASTMPGAG